MKLIHHHKALSGESSKVFLVGWGHYLVRFYNHLGTHMDASDLVTTDREKAIQQATPCN